MRVEQKVTIEMDEIVAKYVSLYNFSLPKIMVRALKDVKPFIQKQPLKIRVLVGSSIPFSRYNTEEECLEIYLYPRWFKPIGNNAIRNLSMKHVFSHEILEAMQNTPFGFKRIVDRIFASLMPSLNKASLGIEPSKEGLELFCQDTCIDTQVDSRLIRRRGGARGFLYAHNTAWGLDQFDINKMQITKTKDRKLISNVDPYYILYMLISSSRRKVICDKIKQLHPDLSGVYIPRYEMQFNRFISKMLRYPEIMMEANAICEELLMENPNPDSVYIHATNILVSFENVRTLY